MKTHHVIALVSASLIMIGCSKHEEKPTGETELNLTIAAENRDSVGRYVERCYPTTRLQARLRTEGNISDASMFADFVKMQTEMAINIGKYESKNQEQTLEWLEKLYDDYRPAHIDMNGSEESNKAEIAEEGRRGKECSDMMENNPAVRDTIVIYKQYLVRNPNAFSYNKPKSESASAPPKSASAIAAELVMEMGPSGWAKCAAGQVSMSAMISRGDPGVQNLKETTDAIGETLGNMRMYMLNHSIREGELDQRIRGEAALIRTGDQAFYIVNQCIIQINNIINKPAVVAIPSPPSEPEVMSVPAPAPEQTAQVQKPEAVPAAPLVADNTPFTPSFDCSKASNGQEKMVCADRDLAKLDVEASQAYAKAREKSADKDALKKEQINWIKFSLRACSDKACLVDSYKKRISELQ